MKKILSMVLHVFLVSRSSRNRKHSKRTYKFLCIFSLFFCVSIYANASQLNVATSNKKVVEGMLQIFSNVNANPMSFSKYLSPNYIQKADGHRVNYKQFLKHVQKLHHIMKSIHFKFDEIIAEGNIVATHHIAYGTKKNGEQVKTEFFAFFTLKDYKIIRVSEVSRMLKGSVSDKNLSYSN